MKAIKNFEEFINEKIVKVQAPNISRSKYLLNEAEKTYFFY